MYFRELGIDPQSNCHVNIQWHKNIVTWKHWKKVYYLLQVIPVIS